jgi:hypothetical protein
LLAGFLAIFIPTFGIVAAIVIPKYADLQGKAKDGMTLGQLGSMRSALAIYYGDTEGQYPSNLVSLVPKYLPEIPSAQTKKHPHTAATQIYGSKVCSDSGEHTGGLIRDKLQDTGQWGYVNDPKASCYGQLFVDCTHRDSRGREWAAY